MKKLLLNLVLLLALLTFGQGQAAAAPDLGDFTVLRRGEVVGQTFVAPHAGLSGIAFLLKFDRPGAGEVYLHLRADPADSTDLAVARLPLSAIGEPAFYAFRFAPQVGSQGKSYYALLDFVGEGQVALAKRPGASYLDGALYRKDGPKNAQAVFELAFDPALRLAELARQALALLLVLLAGAALFVLPGWALLALLAPPGRQLAWPERLGLAAGLSVALYPLLFVWADAAGLRLGALLAWLPPALGLGALLLRWARRGAKSRASALAPRAARRAPPSLPAARPAEGALIGVLVVLFAGHLWMTVGLNVPMWGDSLQHTMIAQLLIDHRGLFTSWEPYTPYASLSVQFGFSSDVAVFAWLTGIASPQATLLVGQLLSALAALTIYPLALRVSGGLPWAGVVAVLIAGLLSPLPAGYLNWGRYAQLAGQVVLPAALWLLWEALDAEAGRWRWIVLAALAAAGMTLSYYRMPFYYTAFLLALLLGWGLPQIGLRLRGWLAILARLVLLALLAGLMLLPWALHVAGGSLDEAVYKGVTVAPLAQRVLADYAFWLYTGDYLPWPFVVLALLSLGLSIAWRRWSVALVGLWVLLLASLVAGRFIRLPGAAQMQNFAIIIALYIPAALLIGWLCAEAAALIERRRPGSAPILAGGLVVAGLLGAWQQQSIADPTRHALVTRPDELALAWVRANTPPDARFLVQSYRINGGTSAVGGDAGWWMPLLGGRQNTLPPQYALLNERPSEPGYSARVVELVAALERTPPQSKAGIRLLCDNSIGYVYSGQRRNLVGEGVRLLFNPDELAKSKAFELIYRRDQVAIFALRPERCGR